MEGGHFIFIFLVGAFLWQMQVVTKDFFGCFMGICNCRMVIVSLGNYALISRLLNHFSFILSVCFGFLFVRNYFSSARGNISNCYVK